MFYAEYEVTGGPDDGLVFPITMRECDEDLDWPKFYEFNPAQKDVIEAHKKANQFFCPKTFDLSVYNTFDNVESKVVNVYMKGCDQGENDLCKLETNTLRDYYDNKMIMLLTNSQHVDFSKEGVTEPE